MDSVQWLPHRCGGAGMRERATSYKMNSDVFSSTLCPLNASSPSVCQLVAYTAQSSTVLTQRDRSIDPDVPASWYS